MVLRGEVSITATLRKAEKCERISASEGRNDRKKFEGDLNLEKFTQKEISCFFLLMLM